MKAILKGYQRLGRIPVSSITIFTIILFRATRTSLANHSDPHFAGADRSFGGFVTAVRLIG